MVFNERRSYCVIDPLLLHFTQKSGQGFRRRVYLRRICATH